MMSYRDQNLGQTSLASDMITRARLNMVESQIRAGGITNQRVIAAMAALQRESFVATSEGVLAYAEIDAKLQGTDRYLLAPPMLARLIDAAQIHEGDLVLDVGCATGYSTAILSDLVGIGTVVGLECDPALAEQAIKILERLNKYNSVIITSPLGQGYPAQGPYDVILLNGASARPPEALAQIFSVQLLPYGRLVGIFDDGGDIKGEAWRWTKTKEGELRQEILFDARAPILPGFEADRAVFRFPGVQVKEPTQIKQASQMEKPSTETMNELSSPAQDAQKDQAWQKLQTKENQQEKISVKKSPLPPSSSEESEESEESLAARGLHDATTPTEQASKSLPNDEKSKQEKEVSAQEKPKSSDAKPSVSKGASARLQDSARAKISKLKTALKSEASSAVSSVSSVLEKTSATISQKTENIRAINPLEKTSQIKRALTAKLLGSASPSAKKTPVDPFASVLPPVPEDKNAEITPSTSTSSKALEKKQTHKEHATSEIISPPSSAPPISALKKESKKIETNKRPQSNNSGEKD